MFVMLKQIILTLDISSLLSSMVVLKSVINISILKSIKNLMTLKILYLKYIVHSLAMFIFLELNI